MKQKIILDEVLFLVCTAYFYMALVFVDSFFLIIFPQDKSQEIFERHSNPLDLSTLIGTLALVPVVLQIIEDRSSERARILAHNCKMALLRTTPLFAGISGAFELQGGVRIFYGLEGSFSSIGVENPALLFASEWIPHFVFLIVLALVPALWEYLLPDSRGELEIELSSIEDSIRSAKFDKYKFLSLPIIGMLKLDDADWASAKRPKVPTLRASVSALLGLPVSFLGLAVHVLSSRGEVEPSLQPNSSLVCEALLVIVLSGILIHHIRLLKIGWRSSPRKFRDLEIFAALILLIFWLLLVVALVGLALIAFHYQVSKIPNNIIGGVLLVVGVLLLVALFALSLYFLSFKKSNCIVGIQNGLKSRALSRYFEIVDAIQRLNQRKKECESRLTTVTEGERD